MSALILLCQMAVSAENRHTGVHNKLLTPLHCTQVRRRMRYVSMAFTPSQDREKGAFLAFMEQQIPLLLWPQDITKYSGFSALKKYLPLSITCSVQKKRSFLVFLQNPQVSHFLKCNVPAFVFQRDLLFVNQLPGSGIELKDVDCGNTFERKNLITIITKSTYSHHLYSKLQTPTLIPNRAKAKWLEWALQMLFAYMIWVRSCKYPKCQTAFQVLCERKSSQCCLLFKRKGSKGNFIRITKDFYEECCIVTHRPTGLHLKVNIQLSTNQNKTSPSSCTSHPRVSSTEGKASQTLQKLTKPGNPCTPLCIQSKSRTQRLPGRPQAFLDTWESTVPRTPGSGKARTASRESCSCLCSSCDDFRHYSIYSYLSHRMAT